MKKDTVISMIISIVAMLIGFFGMMYATEVLPVDFETVVVFSKWLIIGGVFEMLATIVFVVIDG